MLSTADKKRISIFIGFAFGISWIAGALVWLRGGLIDSPVIIPGLNYTEALLLIALLYMPGPALAHILTRWVTREGWSGMQLRPNLSRGWKYWLLGWLGVPALLLLGLLVYFLVFPRTFDSDFSTLNDLLAIAEAASGDKIPFPTPVLLVLMFIQAVLVGPIINAPFIFGEEFGWRAYLQPKLMQLGTKKALVILGIIWGVWHWPILAMGHTFGLGYPGAPWTGWLVFTWFTCVVGTVLGWLSFRGGSVWPAVIGHGVLNGIAGISTLLVAGAYNPLLGPSAAGLVAGIPFSLFALWLFLGGKLREPAGDGA